MEEAPENGKESSNSAHANGMNEITLYFFKDLFEYYPPQWSLPSKFQIQIPTVLLPLSHVYYVLYPPLLLDFITTTRNLGL
jgi:hypothetical protein